MIMTKKSQKTTKTKINKNDQDLMETEFQIEQVIEQIQPAIAMDGGRVDFVSYDPDLKRVVVRMSGACQGCPMSSITLKQGIQTMIQQKLAFVQEVITEDEV